MLFRRPLRLTGGAFVLPAGGAALLGRGPDHEAATAALWSPRDPATFGGLVHYASLAANSHNAQAWRFRKTAGGIAILPDLSRALPVADADHHHLYASLGCAAENLMLAAGMAGRSAALDFRPEGDGRVEVALAPGGAADPLSAPSCPASARARTMTVGRCRRPIWRRWKRPRASGAPR